METIRDVNISITDNTENKLKVFYSDDTISFYLEIDKYNINKLIDGRVVPCQVRYTCPPKKKKNE